MSILSRLIAAALAAGALAAAPAAFADDAPGLRARHTELRDVLRNSPYQRAMHIDSAESGSTLQGDVYAVLDHPYDKVVQNLRQPAQWCDVLLLPFNTKYCHATDGGEGLTLRVGRKVDQPVEQAYKLDFSFRNVAAGNDFYESRLNAKDGPLGTRDYRIVLSAVPIEGGKRTFMHLGYAYGYGAAGRFAMQAYLSTAGADKIGFSVTGRDASGQPRYIQGVRGAVERNAMRYYLAIDAYLASLDSPREQQVERRIQHWFDATERYPRQLREMDRNTYAAMKRHEYERQQSVALQ